MKSLELEPLVAQFKKQVCDSQVVEHDVYDAQAMSSDDEEAATSIQDMFAMDTEEVKASAQDMPAMSAAVEIASAQDMLAMNPAVEIANAQDMLRICTLSQMFLEIRTWALTQKKQRPDLKT